MLKPKTLRIKRDKRVEDYFRKLGKLSIKSDALLKEYNNIRKEMAEITEKINREFMKKKSEETKDARSY